MAKFDDRCLAAISQWQKSLAKAELPSVDGENHQSLPKNGIAPNPGGISQ
jgi:hypothetical protein